ncbi:hypothetical protein LRP50_05290 [Enterovibrio sp. ZSDZ42]|uniref:Uncharacterized protein n=1 Tax=Enterovibrio gelatinilyticus TaxID=2899819 RepID=A0ABT5QX00_9GAMM|nr:hypothetical protein [Enterovibrio sp. ZSDZ42]MDD1792541.1 hypothetical protein [Enterovibrio sp. ZSDZ42]
MNKITVLMAVELDNTGDWLGLADYKADLGENATDLDVFNRMAEDENGSALNALVNLTDTNTPSRFVSVLEQNGAMDEAKDQLRQIINRKPVTPMSPLARRAEQTAQDAEDLAMRIRHREAVTIDMAKPTQCQHGVILHGNCRHCENNPEFS